MAWAVEVDVADWDAQRRGFDAAVAQFGRVDYVCPIAGMGERRTFPNRPNSTGFERPDLGAWDVNMTGFIYTVSLALQQFRRQSLSRHGFRGKGEMIHLNDVALDFFKSSWLTCPRSDCCGIGRWLLQPPWRPHVRGRKTVRPPSHSKLHNYKFHGCRLMI